MTATWAMGKALSELMARHGVTLMAPQAVALSEPCSMPMLLSGLASTLDTDSERVQFAPFAFEWDAGISLKFDHTEQCAGRIELLAHNDRGELTIRAYVDHPEARRRNASALAAMCWITRCTTPIARRSSRASRRSGFARSAWCLRRSTAAPGFCGASCRHRCPRLAPPSNKPIIVEGIAAHPSVYCFLAPLGFFSTW